MKWLWFAVAAFNLLIFVAAAVAGRFDFERLALAALNAYIGFQTWGLERLRRDNRDLRIMAQSVRRWVG